LNKIQIIGNDNSKHAGKTYRENFSIVSGKIRKIGHSENQPNQALYKKLVD
jgi:hypothetical protein